MVRRVGALVAAAAVVVVVVGACSWRVKAAEADDDDGGGGGAGGHAGVNASACVSALDGMLAEADMAAALHYASQPVSPHAVRALGLWFGGETGNFDACAHIEAPADSLKKGKAAHLCLAGAVQLEDKMNTPPAVAGVCVPQHCSPAVLRSDTFADDVAARIEALVHGDSGGDDDNENDNRDVLLTPQGQQAFSYLVTLQGAIQINVDRDTGWTCGSHRAALTLDRRLFLVFLVILLCLVVVSTAYDMVPSGVNAESSAPDKATGGNQSGLVSALHAFSLVRNVRYIFQQREGHNTLGIFDGLRAISIMWVILGHTMVLQASVGYTNPAAVLPPPGILSSTLFGQIVFSSRYAVDTFFFMGGFFVGFAILSRLQPASHLVEMHDRDSREMETEAGIAAAPAVLNPVGYGSVNAAAADEDDGQHDHDDHDHDRDEQLQSKSRPVHVQNHLTHSLPQQEQLSLLAAPPPVRNVAMLSWIPAFYCHRLFRILPPYAFALLLWWKIGVLAGGGPFWYRWASYTERCDDWWWTNLLFVNNLVPWQTTETEECMYVSWFLGVDMQLFLLSPFFVVLYLHKHWLGKAAVITVCAASLFTTAAIALRDGDYSPHNFDGQWVTNYSKTFYTDPYFRLSPYLIGLLMAFFWHERQLHRHRCDQRQQQQQRQQRGRSPSPTTIMGLLDTSPIVSNMTLAFAVLLLTVLAFGSTSAYQQRICSLAENPHDSGCGSGWSEAWRVAYITLTQPAWAIGVALIAWLALVGRAGFLGFLAHPFWAPLAKVSFSVYLLHPLILNLWFLSKTQKFRFSGLEFALVYLAVVLISFGAGAVNTALIEGPFSRLGRLLERALVTRSST